MQVFTESCPAVLDWMRNHNVEKMVADAFLLDGESCADVFGDAISSVVTAKGNRELWPGQHWCLDEIADYRWCLRATADYGKRLPGSYYTVLVELEDICHGRGKAGYDGIGVSSGCMSYLHPEHATEVNDKE